MRLPDIVEGLWNKNKWKERLVIGALAFSLAVSGQYSFGNNYAFGKNYDMDLPIALRTTKEYESHKRKESEKHIPKPEPPKETKPEVPKPPEPPKHPTFYGQNVPAQTKAIIYVIDHSGSMIDSVDTYTGLDGNQVYGGTRLDRAKVELIRTIQQLSEDFYFNIISYDCDLIKWSSQLMPAVNDNKESAKNWINSLRPSVMTGTGKATVEALKMEPNRTVILLTDGVPNCRLSIDSHLQMIQNNKKGKTLHCFGIEANGRFEDFLRAAVQPDGRYYDIN